MRYYLFIGFSEIGSYFFTHKTRKINFKKVVLFGELHYHQETIPDKITVGAYDGARIISVFDETKENAYHNLRLLKRIQTNALKSNTNAIKRIVDPRNFATLFWYLSVVLLLCTIAMCIYMVLSQQKWLCLSFCLQHCAFDMLLPKNGSWCLTPVLSKKVFS